MDALTRRQFDRAMFAKERTLAIRVGDYTSRDIKEASFEYGYIKGDTYKPGGTCAGSGKITFTSIITTFNKLDTLRPEIGLLVGDTYQWVKMGEYFINDIEIDRNRNTTTLELMDGMFKLNREYVTDLHFPAEVREVIQEICLKTGIELANDYFGISVMRYHIEQVPEGKKLSFRDMLSAMTQMIGMSCFFNREGKMEIRDLTESNITINADSYFLHGLTKSEIEYQIAGITCKTDKKSLTVGMKTGRSLELDNVFMTQSALNDLYYKLKNLTYYPYNLNYQGHLLLEVGQWVTIQTNKKETFKVPVLSQSFIFKGGLRGRISADSKAGNDTQYSYEGTITKQIKQQDGVEAKIQAQIEAADKDFDQKVDKIKKDFNDQVELTKARAEEVKRELSDTINQRFNSFDNGPLKETKRKAEEALRNAGASTLLAQEAKRIGLDSVARLEAFKSQTTSAQTALSGDLDALKRTIANDIRPKQAQAEAEIAKQVEALSRTKNELDGASTLLAQEAKRIELDSVARLEAFKSQTTSAQTALSGDLDVLKRTIANDIRPKQAQAEAEIAKQVEALSRTKNELDGVKSAQATYEETTTRRLSELTNLANGKASKSELTQTAEELASRIASVQVGGINLLRNTASLLIGDRSKGCWMSSSGGNGRAISVEVLAPPKKMIKNMIRVIENTNGGNKDLTQLVRLRIGEKYTISCYARVASDSPNANVNLLFRSWANDTDLNRKFQKSISHKNWQKYSFTFTADAIENSIQFGQSGAGIIEICAPKIESGTLATDYSEAPEDIEGQISTVESTFKQRANSLEAGVSRLTEGLRTKADISSLNVTAENIRQSVKSLETDTQNKLNQKLSQAEFEVRAGSIRQEILNATKDKASKSELTQTAEELSSKIASVQVGGRNYIRGTKRMMLARGLWASGTFRPSGAGTAKTIDVSDSPATGFDKAIRLTSSNARDQIGIAQDGFYISQGTYTMSCWVKGRRGQKVKLQTYWQANDNSGISPIFTLKDETWTKLSFTSARNRAGVASIGYVYLVNAEVGEYLDVLAPQLEDGSLATSSKEALEDIEGQISTVESTFKQRANSLDAGVRSLTEGLRTKVDISALNVTAENIRQSVKSLETDTQN
ncbi:peptidase S74, partial [Streptococcus pneumoniae]|nr:peptidase S74 [Streptococcus pneumoniae]